MNVKDLTLRQIEEIQALFGKEPPALLADVHPWEIGKNYLIRTVTMALTGVLKFVGEKELVLSSAAWIADTGRFHDALEDSQKFSEVEPFPEDAIIGRGSIIDATKIKDIITVQK